MTYNGNSRIFSIAHVEVDFLLSGMVMKKIKIDSVNLELSGSPMATVRIILEGLVRPTARPRQVHGVAAAASHLRML